jgi:hypothetical protein
MIIDHQPFNILQTFYAQPNICPNICLFSRRMIFQRITIHAPVHTHTLTNHGKSLHQLTPKQLKNTKERQKEHIAKLYIKYIACRRSHSLYQPSKSSVAHSPLCLWWCESMASLEAQFSLLITMAVWFSVYNCQNESGNSLCESVWLRVARFLRLYTVIHTHHN